MWVGHERTEDMPSARCVRRASLYSSAWQQTTAKCLEKQFPQVQNQAEQGPDEDAQLHLKTGCNKKKEKFHHEISVCPAHGEPGCPGQLVQFLVSPHVGNTIVTEVGASS